jgi:hypothetical protein
VQRCGLRHVVIGVVSSVAYAFAWSPSESPAGLWVLVCAALGCNSTPEKADQTSWNQSAVTSQSSFTIASSGVRLRTNRNGCARLGHRVRKQISASNWLKAFEDWLHTSSRASTSRRMSNPLIFWLTERYQFINSALWNSTSASANVTPATNDSPRLAPSRGMTRHLPLGGRIAEPRPVEGRCAPAGHEKKGAARPRVTT